MKRNFYLNIRSLRTGECASYVYLNGTLHKPVTIRWCDENPEYYPYEFYDTKIITLSNGDWFEVYLERA